MKLATIIVTFGLATVNLMPSSWAQEKEDAAEPVILEKLAGTSWIGGANAGGATVFVAIEFPEEPSGEVLLTMPNAMALRKPTALGGSATEPTIRVTAAGRTGVLHLEPEDGRIGGRMDALGADGATVTQTFPLSLQPWTPPEAFPSHSTYSGTVELPGGTELEIIIEVGFAGDDASARVSIPAQSVESYPSVAKHAEGNWTIEPNFGAPATIQLAPAADGGLDGTMSQAGFEMKMVLAKADTDVLERDRRPQTPKPPFPYHEVEARIPHPEGHELAGTLLLPDGVDDPPAVVFITGSGPQDRDESIMGHKPFHVLADALTRRGLATLRYDDRGVGDSTGQFAGATTSDFATDALAAVAWLRKRDDVDVEWIGLLGHSEGGVVAPIAVSQDPDIAFAVLLAGTGVDGGRILTSQSERIMEVAEMPREDIDQIIAIHEQLMDAVREDAPVEEVQRLYIALSEAQVESSRETLGDEQADKLLESTREQIEQMGNPFNAWMVEFIRMDPRSYLSQMRCPVLAINGTNDVQVLSELNLPEIERAITTGGGKVTVIEYEGMNHLFQQSKTGAVEEYSSIETTMDPVVMEDIAAWILETSGREGR